MDNYKLFGIVLKVPLWTIIIGSILASIYGAIIDKLEWSKAFYFVLSFILYIIGQIMINKSKKSEVNKDNNPSR